MPYRLAMPICVALSQVPRSRSLFRPSLVQLQQENEKVSVGFSTLSGGSQAVGSLPAPKSPGTALGSCAGWLRICAGEDLHLT